MLAVASIALENGADEEEAIAALFHDSIEDQSNGDPEGLRKRISESFGETVLAIVESRTYANRNA